MPVAPSKKGCVETMADDIGGNPYRQLAKRFLITFLLGVLVYRLGVVITIPGIDKEVLDASFKGSGGPIGALLRYADMFNGGAIANASVFGLGIMPYISASIIFQLLIFSFPALKQLQKEGEVGRRKINQYTRYATVLICLVQSAIGAAALTNIANPIEEGGDPRELVSMTPHWVFVIQSMLVITTGSMVLLWLAEQITKFGIGNGVSVVIMVGILSSMPGAFHQMIQNDSANLPLFLGVAAIFVAIIAGMVVLTMARRRINLEQQRRIQGNRVYGGGQTQLPLMINQANVIPVIFASPVITVLAFAAGGMYLGGLIDQGSVGYRYLFAALIIFFTFFYISITLDLKEMANHFKQAGFFVRGIRPGHNTVEYIKYRLDRITFVGAFSLAFIAIMPGLLASGLELPENVAYALLGGVGLLIVVGVSLDIIQKTYSFLLAHQYGDLAGGPGAGGPGGGKRRGGRKRF